MKRAVTGADLSAADIAEMIVKPYGDSYTDTLSKGRKLGRFLLQYGETDWAFLKRLAGIEGGVLTPDPAGSGHFWYGLPDLLTASIEDMDRVRHTVIRYGDYANKNAKTPGAAFLQDAYRFVIKTAQNYMLGQQVTCDSADCVIHRVTIKSAGGLVEKIYEAGPAAGIAPEDGKNPGYAGLHLLAAVKEVKDTRIRVDLGMEQLSGGDELYFSYAAESSAWYCMPEQGSQVHLYLPDMDESKAYAVHSLRNTGAGAKHAASVSDPSVKSFTHPGGSAMKMDGEKILFTADGTDAVSASLGGDGNLKLKAKTIKIHAGGNLRIGAGERKPVQNVAIGAGLDIQVLNEKGVTAFLGEQLYLKGTKISYTSSVHPPVEIPAEILNRNEGIEEKINEINAAAKAMELQKVQEAKQKTGMGLFAIVAGVVAVAAVAVVGIATCGVGLAIIGVAAGATAVTCGAGLVQEGVSDYKKAVESGDFSQSYNFVRDSLLGGNQALYDVLTYGSVLVCGIVVGTVTGGAGWEAFGNVMMRAGTEVGLDTAMNLVMDYCDDGSINNGWESYLKSACMTGGTAGMSMGVMNQFEKLKKAGDLPCKTLEKIRLGVDVGFDSIVAFATTGDVNIGKIFLQNYLANKFTLADPVDGATGSLYIPAVDMSLPDTEEPFRISRKYESVNPRTGLLGRGWTCSLESILKERSGLVHVLCADGHVESFRQTDGAWRNEKGGSLRMTLKEAPDGWEMKDSTEEKTYAYGRNGKLLSVMDRHGNRSCYEYGNGMLTAVTTFTGLRIEVSIRDGRLHQLKDVLGRTFTYYYEEDFLVKTDQNGRGITRYQYDEGGRITEITDQNNKKYTVNRFDEKGRVTRQDYPDGTSCEICYEDVLRRVTFTYPGTGRCERVYHDGNGLVTCIEYQDGTSEEYRYDAWQNRVCEKDRNGGVMKRQYSIFGKKEREERPDGLAVVYAYDEEGRLKEERDNEGGCIRYRYDGNGNLCEKKQLTEGTLPMDAVLKKAEFCPEKWITERFCYDRKGRLLWKEDGCGNRTLYSYREGNRGFLPDAQISPEGYEFRYEYDAAGRKLRVETALGTVSYGYNSLHYATRTIDAEGNLSHEEYDNLGNLIRSYPARLCTSLGGAGTGYRYAYDYLDRLIKVTDPLGREKRYVRDGQGNITYESPLAYSRRVPEQEPQGGEGAGIRHVYDANGNRTRTVCPDGGVWITQYDAKGNLLYESCPEEQEKGNGKRYAYDAMDRVRKVWDEEGTLIKEYRYDKKGRIIEETDALLHHTFYRYDHAGRQVGTWEQVLESAQPGEETGTESGTRKAAQYRASWYVYDAAGNCIEERQGMEAVEPYVFPHRFRKIQKTYDKENRLVRVEDGEGACMDYTYDLYNNRTSERSRIDADTERVLRYRYDKNGRLIRKTEEIDSGIFGRAKRQAETSYRYDANGNLTEVCLPEGGRIRLLYDEADRPVCRMEEDLKNGIRRSMAYLYAESCPFPGEALFGKKQTVKERNRVLMECSQDAQGLFGCTRLWSALFLEKPSVVRHYAGKKASGIYHALKRDYEDISSPAPERGKGIPYGEAGVDYFERQFRYDFRGNRLQETDADGRKEVTAVYCYNKNGELVKYIEPEAYYKAGREGAGTSFTYDSRGNVTGRTNGAGETEYQRTYDGLGRVVMETDGEGNETRCQYDPIGNMTKVTGPDGETDWAASYDLWGRPDCVTDGNGNETRYEKDRWGRVTALLRPDGAKEHYSYDYAGNIRKAVDAMGRKTVFCYTSQSRTSSITKADGTTEYFLYDLEGRYGGRLDRNGCLTEIRYNMDGNAVCVTGRRTAPEEGNTCLMETPEERETWERVFHREYPRPEVCRLYTYAADGMLKSASGDGTVYHYTRDKKGRMLQKEAWGKTLVSCTYDRNGRMDTVTTPAGAIRYSYDAAGRLKKAGGEDGFRAEYQYTKNGMQSEVLYGNGLCTGYGYDARKRLISLTAGMKGKEPLFMARYQYDRNGNRIQKEEIFSKHAETTSYQYDCRNQLTGEARAKSYARYCYDPAGNRIKKDTGEDTEQCRYNSRNQLMERSNAAGVTRYEYDAAGNLAEELRYRPGGEDTGQAEKSICYQYDVFNRNTQVQGTGFLQKNRYDAEGLRCEIEENGRISRYIYHEGMLLAELDHNKEPAAGQYLGNTYLGGRLACRQDAEKATADGTGSIPSEKKTCYYIIDEQESIRYVLDEAGEILNHYQYNAFGETEREEESCCSHLRYNSQIHDELTDQYYLRARYYQPQLGRFTQEDLLYADGLNLYAYCKNNPVVYCDPSGLKKKTNVPNSSDCDPKELAENTVGEGESDSVKPEAAVTGSKKHGVNWKEGPARAKATGNPQGQWAKSDLDYATEMANTLKPGESGYFDLPKGSQSIVHMSDGTTQSATRMWIRNNGTGTWHGYPMP